MMLLIDKDLIIHGKNIITPFDERQVTNISYDLTTAFFCYDSKEKHKEITCSLKPGACVFVEAVEAIDLPNNMYAQVVLRNKRIRQGLDISAPVYQPGHHTKVYFRIMNVSNSVIRLTDQDNNLASLMLYELHDNVDKPYAGAFQSEFDFKNLGNYAPDLEGELSELNKKIDHVGDIEKSIYGNVLSIMAIFVAVFSLINVNINLTAKDVAMKTLLTLNLVTVGSIAALISTVQACMPAKKMSWLVLVVCIVAYILSVVIQFIPF